MSEYPTKRRPAERWVYVSCAVAMVVGAVGSTIGGNVVGAVWALSSAIAWMSAAAMANRIRLLHEAIGSLETMVGIVRAEDADVTRAVIRTRHPDHFLLHNTHDGTRWRMSPTGWTREDW